LAGCSSPKAATPTSTTSSTPAGTKPSGTNLLSDESARVSYAVGMMFGHMLQSQGVEVNADTMIHGFKDMQAGGAALLTQAEMRDTLNEYQKTLNIKKQQFLAAVGMTNKEAGAAFLATNKNNPGVITLPDGLQYSVITNGTGPQVESNDVVTVNYRGTLLDGSEFDSSFKRQHPAQFPVGNLIPGWTEALQHMTVGSKWKVWIPSDLAYREQGRPGITPNSLLVFELEVLAADHPKPPAPITSDIVKVPSLEEMKNGAKIEVIKPEDAAKAQESQGNPPAH
jgi:FKBP-type peptidyl-prolyl cis-trans isomerase